MPVKTIKSFIKKNPHIWWALYLLVYLALYLTVEHVVDGSKPYWVPYLPLDDVLPFCELFIVPYCTWYPILVATGLYLMFKNGGAFRRYMQFIAIGFTISTLICFLVPNGQNLRPEHFARDNIFTRLIADIYAADTNTNVFPSVHVVGCFAACFAMFDAGELWRLRVPMVLQGILISVSTVMIKQHSTLDIVGAIALCVPIWIFLRHRRSVELEKEKNPGKKDPSSEAADPAE